MRFLTGFFSLTLCLTAEQGELSSSPDFSAGFEELVALDLPNLAGAIWVSLHPVLGEAEGWDARQEQNPIAGKGWALRKAEPDAVQRFVVGVRELQGYAAAQVKAVVSRADTMNWNERNLWGNRYRTTFSLANLLGDLAAVNESLDFFENMMAAKPQEFQNAGTGPGLAPFLIFATQLWQLGHHEAANKLANRLLHITKPPSKLIDSVVNFCAQRDLEAVTETFQAKPDWNIYEDGLSGLVARYPRGWKALEGGVTLLRKVRRHAEAPVPVETMHLPPGKETEVKELLDRLVNESLDINQCPLLEGMTPWVLREDAESLEEPWRSLQALGLDGVLALTNLIGDAHLTHAMRPVNSSYGAYSFHENQDPFLAIPRPLTRVELALQLINNVLPATLQSVERDHSFQANLADWCRRERGKSRGELALAYFIEENSRHAQPAIAILIEEDEASLFKAVEEHLYEKVMNEPPLDYVMTSTLRLVETYITQRGKEASQAFYDRLLPPFEKRLQEAVPEGGFAEGASEAYQLQQVRVALTNIKGRFDDNLIETLLSGLESGETPLETVLEPLQRLLTEKPPLETWPAIIQGLTKIEDLAVLSAILQQLSFQSYRLITNEAGEKALAETEATRALLREALLNEELRPAWHRWLENTETFHAEYQTYPSPSHQATTLLNTLSPDIEALMHLGMIYDRKEWNQRIVAYAKAMVDGESLPNWPPKSDNVSEERRQQLTKEAADQKSAAFVPWYRTLKEDERLFLAQAFQENPEQAPFLAEAMQHLHTVSFESEALEKIYTWQDLMGEKANHDSLEKIALSLRKLSEPAMISIAVGTYYEGCLMQEMPLEQAGYYVDAMPEEAKVALYVQQGSENMVLFWDSTREAPVEGNLKQLENLMARRQSDDFQNIQFVVRPLDQTPAE